MSELTLPSSRITHHAQEAEEKRAQERKRFLLHIIEDYLREEGFWDASRALNTEAKLNSNTVVCDNIDLLTILKEYEAFYQMKFGKAPKLCRRRDPAEQSRNPPLLPNAKSTRKPAKTSITHPAPPAPPAPAFSFDMIVVPHNPGDGGTQNSTSAGGSDSICPILPTSATTKPLSGFYGASIELREMVELISKDMVQRPTTRLKDVIGLDSAKRALEESILLPRKHPNIFRGVLAPNVGILLHGPPGTGKTLLATAIAGETPGVLVRLHASSLISKWRGDSEKLVRVLFDLARYLSPSIIFLDEVDALVSRRGGRSEHEATRRMQAELLLQLDLLTAEAEGTNRDASHSHGDSVPAGAVTVIAATNVPWELDGALLRRLGKRILVDLPDSHSRGEIIKSLIPPRKEIGPGLILTSRLNYSQLAKETQGYSGSDLKVICKEAATGAARGMLQSLHEGKNLSKPLDVIEDADMSDIIHRVRPSATYETERFQKWHLSYGSN